VIVSSEGHKFAYQEGIRFEKINDDSVYVIVVQLLCFMS
jgi:hypothetical protein